MPGPKAHAELGASSSARWIACPGSVPLSRAYEARGSSYAAEGSVAHALCETALAGGELTPVGETVEYDGHHILITREMHDAVEVYVTAIQKVFDGSEWHSTEEQVSILSAPEGAEVFGTADAVAVKGLTLHVGDFKYGKGVKVDVEDNTQLLFYALATWETLETYDPGLLKPVKEVRLTVCQPRVDGPALKVWDIGVVDLMIWRDDVLLPAIQRIMDGDETLQEGNWCRFCPALAACPLKHAAAKKAARMAFESDWEDPGYGSNSGTLSGQEIANRLTLVRSLKDYIKALEGEVLQLMRMGDEVPGYKLVEGRSVRKWVGTPQETLALLVRRLQPDDDFLDEIMVPATVRPLTEIEKVLKHRKLKTAPIMGDLVWKPPGKPTLVQAADPRPALPISTAAEVFEQSYTDEDE